MRTIRGTHLAGLVAACCGAVASAQTTTAPASTRLELRQIHDGGTGETVAHLPPDAVRVFVYEGAPQQVLVTPQHIAVDYGVSGVLFERATGARVQRLTVADGWPSVRPEAFGTAAVRRRWQLRVGADLVYVDVQPPRSRPKPLPGGSAPESDAAEPRNVLASADFGGQSWRALLPERLLHQPDRPDPNQADRHRVSWTKHLRHMNDACYIEVYDKDGAALRRYTTADGLASNIVTHLAVANGTLWAACVDIFDPDTQQWGPGGLCRFDPATQRWQRVAEVDGRPVRWVTLLQTVGDDLWVGFREGHSVVGDEIYFGMGVMPGIYRPNTTAIVLARLHDGVWRTYARPPEPDGPRPFAQAGQAPEPSSEQPHELAVVGDTVLLFAHTRSRQFDFWGATPTDGKLSVLDLATGRWRVLGPQDGLDADELVQLVAEEGEVLVTSTRGVHRWDARAGAFRFLDPKCDLRNPSLVSVTPVGDELWVGCTNQSFGVIGDQGISRYNERTDKWAYTSPDEIGTASPVRAIAALPSGDVWVCFEPRESSAAMEYPYYLREAAQKRPVGFAQFSHGRWRFPVPLVDAASSQPATTRSSRGPGMMVAWTRQMLVLGDKLFAADTDGVYVGPDPWRQILDGPVLTLELTPERDAVLMLRGPGPTSVNTGGSEYTFERGRYTVATGKVSLESVTLTEEQSSHLWQQASLLTGPVDPNEGEWVTLRTTLSGRLALGPLAPTHRAVIETPSAVWIASLGQLIRLDRAKLTPWLDFAHD